MLARWFVAQLSDLTLYKKTILKERPSQVRKSEKPPQIQRNKCISTFQENNKDKKLDQRLSSPKEICIYFFWCIIYSWSTKLQKLSPPLLSKKISNIERQNILQIAYQPSGFRNVPGFCSFIFPISLIGIQQLASAGLGIAISVIG